jgi:predicted transcriptional regulator of viral defense system
MMLPARDILAVLARASSGGLVSVAAAAEALHVSSQEAAVRLARLKRAGWLARARRGLYLVRPLESAPSAVATIEDPWVLARELFSPCYIAGWTAAEHWGLTEQIFRETMVATAAPRRKSHERRLSTEFRIVRVGAKRLRGITEIWRGSERVSVSDRERTLVDALTDPSWVGGVRHLAEILVSYRDSEHFDVAKLLARLDEVGNGAANKRMGFLAEALWPNATAVLDAARARRTKGIIRLDPSVKSRGRMSKRWGLWVNVNVTPGYDTADDS